MKKTFAAALLAASAVLGLTLTPANADVVYMSSDGSLYSLDSSPMTFDLTPTVRTEIVPAPVVERTIVNSAVIEPMTTTRVITQPAVVQPTVTTQPLLIDREDNNHLLHFNLFPLIDFSLF